MDQLIKITEQEGKRLVDARELHEFLESGQEFTAWIKNRIDKFDFIENQDYASFDKFIKRETGGTTRKEYAITIEMAKELAMVENNEKGKQARRYFIEIEKKYLSQAGLVLPSRKELARWVLEQEEQIERLQADNNAKDSTIQKLKPKADLYDQLASVDRTITIGQLSKLLRIDKLGPRNLMKELRQRGLLFKNRNEPMQQYVAQGIFVVKQRTVPLGETEKTKVILLTLVTPKGIMYIAKLLGVIPKDPEQMQLAL